MIRKVTFTFNNCNEFAYPSNAACWRYHWRLLKTFPDFGCKIAVRIS